MSNNIKSGKIYKRSSLILGALLILTIGLAVLFFVESQNAKASLAQSNDHSQGAEFYIDSLTAKSTADDLFINGDMEEALKAYSAVPNIEQSALLQQRQERKERMNAREKNTNTQLADLQERYKLLTTSTAINTIAVRNSFESQKDSLRMKLETEIADLEEDLEAAEEDFAQAPQLNRLVFKNSKGTEVNYFGEVKNSKANGEGVGIHNTGSVYNGQWKDNAKHGKGIYTWMEGEIYEGEFVNDQREGEGTYHWTNGNKYVGNWQDDMRNGYGKLFDKDNNLILEGDWEDGELSNKAATVNNISN